MPDMQRVDRGVGHPQAPSVQVPQVSVCERSSFFDARDRCRPDWPFKHYQYDNCWYVNRARKRSAVDEAQDVGEALW